MLRQVQHISATVLGMAVPQSHHHSSSRWIAIPASLVPCAAFVLAMVITDKVVDAKSLSSEGLPALVPYCLGFVALPSALPLAVARRHASRILVAVALTLVAALAGALIVATDDAQAGLAVLWVPLVAVPLAVVVGLAQALAGRRRSSPPAPGAATTESSAPRTAHPQAP